MKKVCMLFMVITMMGLQQTMAQASKWRMGVSAMPGVATNGGYGFALGTDIRLQAPIAKQLHFMLTTGLSGFFKKGDVKGMSYIPVKPGLKYFLGDNLYLGGEVGIGFGMVKNSGRSFIWSPSVGLAFKKVDLSVKYEDASDFKFPDGTNNNYLKQVALRVAYGFSLQ